MNISKKQKLFYRVFCIVTVIMTGFGSLTAYAEDTGYEGCPQSVLEMISVRNNFKDIVRWVGWGVLKFLANAIDSFDNAIKAILKLNLYDYLSESFSFSSLHTAVIATMSIALIIACCYLMLNPEKVKISEFLFSLMTSCILLIAFPTFISACNSLKSRGVKAAQSVSIKESSNQTSVDDEGIVSLSTLGSDLLGEGVYVVYNSVDSKKPMSYTDVYGSSANVKELNIKGTLEPSDSNKWTKYKITDVNTKLPVQRKYSELTTANMMELLGLGQEYYFYNNTDDKFILITRRTGSGVVCIMYTSKKFANGNRYAITEGDYETFVSASFGDEVPYGVKIGDLYYSNGDRISEAQSFEIYLKDAIANHPAVRAAGKTQAVGANSRTIDEALEIIKDDVIRDLNIAANTRQAKDIEQITTEYSAKEMFDEDDYDNLDTAEAFLRDILYGSTSDCLYAYHIDYLETLILMIVVAVCLFLSGVKITVTMFEIMFSQLITPFVIATDLQNSGRSKKAIQNMLLSTIVLMIVVIILRLYIAVIWGVKDSKAGDSFAVMIIVIIAGAKFVIDGPDLLTKLFGIDAGVKSAAGTVMALTQMAQTGGFMTMSTARMGGSLVHAGTHMGGKIVKSAGGAVAGGVKGFAGGVYGGVTQGQSVGCKIGRAFAGAATGTAAGTVGGAMGHSDIGAKAGYAVGSSMPIQNVKNTFEGGFKSEVGNIAGNAKDKIVGGLDKMVGNAPNDSTSASAAFSSTDNSSVNSHTAGSGAGFSSSTDNKISSETTKTETAKTETNTNEKGSGFGTVQTNSASSSSAPAGSGSKVPESSSNPGSGFGNQTPKDGKDGLNGINGEKGADGAKGEKGAPGANTNESAPVKNNEKGQAFNNKKQ